MIVTLLVSVPLNNVFNQGYTGNTRGNAVVDYLMIKRWPFFICSVMGQLSIEFLDKLLTVGSVYLVIMGRRLFLNRTGEPGMGA